MIFGFFYRRKIKREFGAYRKMLLANREACIRGELRQHVYRSSVEKICELVDASYYRNERYNERNTRALLIYIEMSDFLRELRAEKINVHRKGEL